ncbi:MAG: class II glutamine amidotransferase [Halorhodospira sp.]
MCELLAMSARQPTALSTSLELFRPRGGQVGPHADGWGVAFYEDWAPQVIKEPAPAYASRLLRFIQGYAYRSRVALSQIRRANPSSHGRRLANTHPFQRELDGRCWVFAHNGKLPHIERRHPRRFQPLGETDSERAFCFLLDALAHGPSVAQKDHPERWVDHLLPVVNALNPGSEFNFLLSDGVDLIVHAHTRMHILERSCEEAGCCQRVRLVATHPLSDEPWKELEPNTLLVLRHGEQLLTTRSTGEATWFSLREGLGG